MKVKKIGKFQIYQLLIQKEMLDGQKLIQKKIQKKLEVQQEKEYGQHVINSNLQLMKDPL